MAIIQTEAYAYKIEDTLPTPDFNTVTKEYDYKKLWGSRYRNGLHSLNWNQSKGWKGLLPGKSSLAQAFTTLGEPVSCHRWGTGWRDYGFKSGVCVGTMGNQPTIQSVDIYPCEEYIANFPLTMHDAKLMYGPIEKRMKVEGCVVTTHLKRPGLTIDIFPESGTEELNACTLYILKKVQRKNKNDRINDTKYCTGCAH